MSKIKTGILGGSFNPIHNGHVAIANAACASRLIDELWLMVSPQNPLKENQELMDDGLRLHMAKLATKDFPQIKVSDFEFQLPRPSYTYNTLQQLETTYPEREFILIIGADNWKDFHKWYKSKYLLSHYQFVVYPRDGYPIQAEDLSANVHYLNMPLYNISSTEIRKRLAKNEEICDWLNAEVEQELKSVLSKSQRRQKYPPCDQ